VVLVLELECGGVGCGRTLGLEARQVCVANSPPNFCTRVKYFACLAVAHGTTRQIPA
jgi:hypothetical protein